MRKKKKYNGTRSLYLKAKKRSNDYSLLLFVVPPGIEPGTQGFSVLCSTN